MSDETYQPTAEELDSNSRRYCFHDNPVGPGSIQGHCMGSKPMTMAEALALTMKLSAQMDREADE
jgi:hypothetical protein